MGIHTFIYYNMMSGYVRCMDDKTNRIYRIQNGVVKCGDIIYEDPNVFAMEVYGLRNHAFIKKLLFSDDSKFSWIIPLHVSMLQITDFDMYIKSYGFRNNSLVEFYNKKINRKSRRFIRNHRINRYQTFAQIASLVEGYFMDEIYITVNKCCMNLRSWKHHLMTR